MRKLLGTLLAAALLVCAAAALGAPPSRPNDDKAVTFFSRNLYLGADLTEAITAYVIYTTSPSEETFVALLLAVEDTWQRVVTTDFPTRANAIALEIKAARPALVGLQEVALWRSQFPGDGPATPAEHVEFDFLALLLDELESAGVPYDVVTVTTDSDVEAPRLGGFPPDFTDVRFTDQDAILVRRDLVGVDFKLFHVQAENFETAIPLGGDLFLLRGWNSVDVLFRGKSFRFVNTHLESDSAEVRNAQAYELAIGPLATLPVVAVGDFNSGPGTDTDAYAFLTAPIPTGAGLQDTWLELHPTEDGFTCCQAELLDNATSQLDQRIDHILHRAPWGAVDMDVVGETEDEMFGGLWPSDHAGVFGTLKIKKPRD